MPHLLHLSCRINFTITQCLVQDGAHVVVSSRKQQKVTWAGAALQREGLSMTGTMCHLWKGEDWERLVATVRSIQGSRDGATVILLLITSPREKAP